MVSDKGQDDDPTVPKMALPGTTVQAVQMAVRLRRIEAWADRIAVRGEPMRPLAFSRGLVERFDIRFAPGSRALAFAQRLLPDPLDMGDIEMVVSPFAPPMRQLSGVRQGVPMWSAGSAAQPQIPAVTAAPRTASARSATVRPAAAPPIAPVPSAKKDAPKEIPADLMAILNAHRALGRSE